MPKISDTATIHKTAIVEDGAAIGDYAYVGPYCCIGKDVVIGNNVKLESHVVITERTTIGDNSIVYPFASLGQKPQDLKYKNEKSRLEIGENTTIREYVTASIGTQGGGMVTKIGDDCLVMAYCHIAHDCIIGNNVVLVNGVNLSGHVVVEDMAIVGGMSAVKQFIRIGKHAMIGGCTGVDRDIIPYGIAISNRTTTLQGLNVIGLKRHGFSIDQIKEMQRAYDDIFENPNESISLTEKLKIVQNKYKNNQNILDIVNFIASPSRNPICTARQHENVSKR
ncbi:MAG: acyl-ACP--UDP-N-acetylglucosamine O-acyltransferase [Holosporales bacterium]|jgi:UDP-N-acetylglucosamine acyltransferase|nr:acyl-ACP--UDP-N-acetylglucosamine O-acyltransferase [Holosporales bacterium]